jgi:hypothetical protein
MRIPKKGERVIVMGQGPSKFKIIRVYLTTKVADLRLIGGTGKTIKGIPWGAIIYPSSKRDVNQIAARIVAKATES